MLFFLLWLKNPIIIFVISIIIIQELNIIYFLFKKYGLYQKLHLKKEREAFTKKKNFKLSFSRNTLLLRYCAIPHTII